MPKDQDVPVEASEVLAFTPASLEACSPKPVFNLRSPTSREKRFRLRMQRENGVFTHSGQAFRDEMMNGLKAQWTEEQFAEYSGWITAYWDAEDAFAEIRKEDPKAEWVYDEEIERAVIDLQQKLEKSWPPLARMYADAAEFRQMQPLFYLAVTVIDWTGFDVKRDLDRGYLTIDCADAIQEKLATLDEKMGNPYGTALGELFAQVLIRTHLDEEEGKNSESPSPSKTTQEASTPTSTSETDGSSPESTALSTETPASA